MHEMQVKGTECLIKGLSQPPGGKRLIPLMRRVIQVMMGYYATTVIFIVLLVIH